MLLEFSYSLLLILSLNILLCITSITMERLFSPCTRLRNILESVGSRSRELERLQELNLNVSTEELLSAESGFTFADLYDILGNGAVAWLTPHTAVANGGRAVDFWTRLNNSCYFRISTDNDKDIYALARSREHLLDICDVVLRLLAASVVHSVVLNKWGVFYGALINAPTLAYLMEQCQSLKVLVLHDLTLDEHHCRVLRVYSRPDLEIELKGCAITPSGASALAADLARNQGPTRLECCKIDGSILADGLRGNSRLKYFRPSFSVNTYVSMDNREVVAIAGALRENRGLVELELNSNYSNMNDETWGAVCDSLKTHPTLEVLHLIHGEHTMATDVITSRTQALVDMIKVNTSIHTLHVHYWHSEHEMYRGSVIPYLETNRLRPRVLAIQKARPIAYRAKVLGQALLAVRTDPNRFWMLLSGNPEVAFPSRTPTSASTANILTPAAATSALTTTVTGSLPAAFAAATTRAFSLSSASASDAFASIPPAAPANAAAANVATPSTGQKRKARP
jgi:hypothetical protein